MIDYKESKQNMEEDINKNLLILNRNHCEIQIKCGKCLATEPDVNFFTNHENIENKEYINNLEHNKIIWKAPWFLLIMCLLQISLFWIANACMRQHLLFMPERANEYWRYITYMLLHSDMLHLTLNVCLQLVIGFCLESEQGHLKVACVYVTGGVAGSLATFYLQPQLSLMGASAGVYAMLMSHIPHLLKNFDKLPHRYLRILAVVILIASDMCFTSFHVFVNQNRNPRICLEAHAAGAISGLLSGSLIYGSISKRGLVGARKRWLQKGVTNIQQ